MMNNRIPDNQLLAEDTVRPIPFFVIVILWAVGLYVIPSTILSFLEPIPKGVPNLFRFHIMVFDGLGVILVPVIMVVLITGFTAIYIMFKGVRYHIFIDRIEYEQGKYPQFGPTQTLLFDELNSIFWRVHEIGDDGPSDTTFIEFHFASRVFQLHNTYYLSRQVAEACRKIERDVIAPKILRALEEGEALTFLPPDKSPSCEIRIDNKSMQNWDQHRFAWSDIRAIRFSKGKVSGCSDFLAQSRIRIENSSGEAIEFDMPRHNPHAFWTVLLDRCNSSRLQVLDFPKKESLE